MFCYILDAARCVLGRRAKPALTDCPVTPTEGCGVTTAPASLEGRGSVLVRTQYTRADTDFFGLENCKYLQYYYY